jgi:dihydroorotate dehydrogenase
VGLAAGLDKNGEYIDALARLGFGFLEIGTVTPRPQPGNPKPRMFRLPEHEAIINRLGFNNHGVEKLLRNVERASFRGVLGHQHRQELRHADRARARRLPACLEAVYDRATYVTVNISSPNTKNLRDLQSSEALDGCSAR